MEENRLVHDTVATELAREQYVTGRLLAEREACDDAAVDRLLAAPPGPQQGDADPGSILLATAQAIGRRDGILERAGDTYPRMPLEAYVRAALEMGLVPVLIRPFGMEAEAGRFQFDTHVVLWSLEGIIVNLSSRQGLVATAHLYYVLEGVRSTAPHLGIPGGGALRAADGLYEGTQDVRIGLRSFIRSLRRSRGLVVPWGGHGGLSLTCEDDRAHRAAWGGWEYSTAQVAQISQQRLDGLPLAVQRMVRMHPQRGRVHEDEDRIPDPGVAGGPGGGDPGPAGVRGEPG